MKNSKRVIIGLIVGLVILTLSAQWLLGKIANQNISKSILIEQLEKVTGYDVAIQGPLHWHFSLRPSIGIEKITFSSNKEQVIVVDGANLRLQLLAIFNPTDHSEDAEFSFEHWQQNQVKFSNGSTHIDYKNKQLIFSKFSAQFYQGHINGNAHIDLNTSTPEITLTLEASQVEISELLKDIAHNPLISGKANLKANLTSQGKDATQFIEHLNGKVSLQAKSGQMNAIHLDPSRKNIDVFDTLTIDAILKNGIANTTSKILAKNYHSNGKGTINLIAQTLNLHFDTYYDRSKNTKEIAIPVEISGPIASPVITIDFSQPIQQFLNSDRKTALKNKIHRFLGR